MSKQELKNYFRWFFDVLPQRINELTEAVIQSAGFENWRPDQKPDSLDMLGAWFASQAHTRPRTSEEIQRIASGCAYPIEVPNEELTNRTFSLAMDIGMYLSQVFLKNHPSLRWDQPFGSKNFADYGQPVLVGFGNLTFNPVYMVVGLAYGLVGKEKTGNGLRRIYDIWSEMI